MCSKRLANGQQEAFNLRIFHLFPLLCEGQLIHVSPGDFDKTIEIVLLITVQHSNRVTNQY